MRTLASAWLRRLRIGPDGTVKDRPYPLGWDAFGNFSFIRVNTSHCPILPIEAHERRLPPQPTGQNDSNQASGNGLIRLGHAPSPTLSWSVAARRDPLRGPTRSQLAIPMAALCCPRSIAADAYRAGHRASTQACARSLGRVAARRLRIEQDWIERMCCRASGLLMARRSRTLCGCSEETNPAALGRRRGHGGASTPAGHPRKARGRAIGGS